jgi:predicted TIM-barrel fold metal-dependent hydrolase
MAGAVSSTADPAPRVFTVDSQIHLWSSGTPGGTHHRHPFTEDEAIAAMDAAGVDASVVVPPPWDPRGDAIAIAAAHRHPDRFAVTCTAALDPSPSRRLPDTLEQLGVVGMRVAFSLPRDRARLADGSADWLWPAAERAGVPLMVFAPGSLAEVEAVARRHPGLKIALDHMGLETGTTDARAFVPVRRRLGSLATLPNVAIKLTSAPIYSSGPYPFRSIDSYLREIFEAFGPARCFWGTDITRLSCSWRECVTHFTEELAWLTGRDRELVMGRALCDWLGWNPAPRHRPPEGREPLN